MPHIIIEHNEVIQKELNLEILSKELHSLLAGLESIKIEAIKTRTVLVQNSVIANHVEDPGFLHITLLLLKGRSEKLKETLGKTLFDKVSTDLSKLPELKSKTSFSLELRELETYFK